ncbi:iron-containing alcohol dehydrogenase [Anaerosalibacter bizertensis]|uniref:Iron-containing alcohol dehydrogenase n=1 Tax=Anaerosalibacter bizertensis TaxID=932217 RepID=A0A844FF55_9FIRM|nr:iron-containing alcohol dehydrogenase [Anaerosalibacter bizertensis]MBV1816469.1 iron-containing alcohol dehydrogenase [Bacteroidales bacterium MSK.15.36]HHV26157.1 iron-containing alcohol dehydrogenase [Tissierellia bacterium]MBU5292506.1 iron-containing alcohol dehydrogenase [Anaerosalibacter bizertensis]MCB5558528.1 iron-containing alcohol dehydrogenase [Anaerosalibacter bizertensis]MCG4563858.1 iron-containing alcohol dehydrogenase [Anaerosalibacter bizertensis]
MLNFNYSIPTKIFFGDGQIEVLGNEIKKYGSKVLLVYGKGSIKKTGIYDEVVNILKSNNIEYWELAGVDPNPRITSVREGIKICREEGIDFILPIGGGSSIDCAKVIAAGYYYEGDPWDFLIKKAKVEKALPLGAILTLSATGSEMDAGAVITNMETNQKLSVGHPSMAPKFSILDPTYTFTVPKSQTAAGVADIMSHIFESYFSRTKEAYLQDRMAEALLKTCIKYGKIAIDEPENYEARSNIMWASSLAINGLLGYGKGKDFRWSVHAIEHELSAYYDITHGVGLAILYPNWMRHVLDDENVYKFVEYGVNIWGIDENKSDYVIANEAIDKTREYFNSLGLPSTLKEVGIGKENLEKMAKAAVDHNKGTVGSFKPLTYEDVLNIYMASL